MLIKPLEVIWIDDDTIKPPGPKMVACIHPENGWYFRINSKRHWQTPVKLEKHPHHPFLKHTSYLECGEPLELDDFLIEEAIRKGGVIGVIATALAPAIYSIVSMAKTFSPADKEAIRIALGC